MEKCLVLLRGINVGGSNVIKMEELKKTFEEFGFTGVRTYIASGNVIFDSPGKDREKLARSIEKKLSEKYKTELKLVITGSVELKKIVEQAPKNFGKESKLRRYDVWFLREALTVKEVLEQIKPLEGVDTISGGKGVVYASRLISMAGKSHLLRVNQMPIYQNLTVRSWNTVVKLLKLIEEEKK